MTAATQIHTCVACNQKLRLPLEYTGIAVCANCWEPLFPTEMREGKAGPTVVPPAAPWEVPPEPPTSSVPEKRSKRRFIRRFTWRDRYLAIPILMLAVPIYQAINYDWAGFFNRMLGWLALVTANLTVLTAIALSWLVIAFGLKVIWEEVWGAMKQRRLNPPIDEEPLLDIGPWEAAQDYITLARQKWQRFALRKERHETH